MSIHQSLKVKNKLKRSRNVLKRAERIAQLKQEGKWLAEKDSLFGLPKVRVAVARKGKAKKKKEEAPEAAAAGEAPAAPSE